jgi:hypothetical protein
MGRARSENAGSAFGGGAASARAAAKTRAGIRSLINGVPSGIVDGLRVHVVAAAGEYNDATAQPDAVARVVFRQAKCELVHSLEQSWNKTGRKPADTHPL